MKKVLKRYIFCDFLVLIAKGPRHFFLPFFSSKPLFGPKNGPKIFKKVVLGKLFDHFNNYHTLRYDIYDFLKKVSGGP